MRRRTVVISIALTLIALALALSACGGGSDDPTTTTPPASAGAAPGGGAAPPSLSVFPPEFLQCLKDQGIDLQSATDISAVIHSPQGDKCFDLLHGG
jgi:ABC-type uncharacterized transport system auxiliary subunit